MLALMPAIFTCHGSWMVTGLTLAISMVTAAMSIAIGAEPIWVTEENDLLEFAVMYFWRIGYSSVTLRIPTSFCYRSEWKPSLTHNRASFRTTI